MKDWFLFFFYDVGSWLIQEWHRRFGKDESWRQDWVTCSFCGKTYLRRFIEANPGSPDCSGA